jgi:hypothetical protein
MKQATAIFGSLLLGALATTSARATIVVHDTPIVVPLTNFNGIYLNFATGEIGLPDMSFSNLPAGWDLIVFNNGASPFLGFNATPTGSAGAIALGPADNPYADLSPGAVVSLDDAIFQSSNSSRLFATAGPHILGFVFYNEAIADFNFGYLNITTSGNNAIPATITSFSYEDTPRGAITVAAPTVGSPVPEPATWAMMMAGLGAIGASMRRRQRSRVSSA